MRNKYNLVLYIDKELVEKSKELGVNLSKTFENHLKHLMTSLSKCNSVNNFETTEKKVFNMGLPVPKPKWVQNHNFSEDWILRVSDNWRPRKDFSTSLPDELSQEAQGAGPTGIDPKRGRAQILTATL